MVQGPANLSHRDAHRPAPTRREESVWPQSAYRRTQAFRIDAGDPRRRHRDRRRRVLRAGRAVGLRQVDAAAHDRRARGDQRRRDHASAARVVNEVAPKERDIAMVFQNYALYPHMTVRDNMSFALMLAKQSKGEIERRRRARRPASWASRELLDRYPRAAVRRAAAARGARARDRARPAGVPVRRAAVQPRREAARADAHRDQGAAPAAKHDVDLRHPRPGRGDDDGRPDRRDARRQSSSRSAPRSSSTTRRRTASSPASSARRR